MTNSANKWGEWVWRAAVFLVLAGQLWVSSHFVSKEEFKDVTLKLGDLREQVLIIRENLKNNERMDREISELKSKFEAIERETLVREARLQQIEKRVNR